MNASKGSSLSMHTGSVSLSLAEGCMHEVFVSSIVGGGEFRLRIRTNSICELSRPYQIQVRMMEGQNVKCKVNGLTLYNEK